MINLILCGGAGTRLWPLSRNLLPKQFLKIFNNESLFQSTLRRNLPFCEKVVVISNSSQYFLAAEQLSELKIDNSDFILEPIGRNTAPAIALASLSVEPENIILVTPSDHIIKNIDAYKESLKSAELAAQNGKIVTFGIKPEYPETGYGYIEAEDKCSLSPVKQFKEKPDYETAKAYLENGSFFWNSGMFCFKASVMIEALEEYAPEILLQSKTALENARKLNNQIFIQLADMENIHSDSIDYAVMEKSKNVVVVPCNIGWNDVGSFEALYQELEKDDSGNTVSDVISIDSANNLVISDKKTALIDIEDSIVISTPDSLLITKKGSGQKVKTVVERLKLENSELINSHPLVHRPWGTFQTLDESSNFKIKKIIVQPGKKLSLQKHFHRSEHWVVVSGSAKVTFNGTEKMVNPNESTYIPIGGVHRLENPGKIPLIIIEVQVGEYVGEDDIVRLEDDFYRHKQ